MNELINKVRKEFQGITTQAASVYTSDNLKILADWLQEQGVLCKIKSRRQGKRGKRSAYNHLLRRALGYVRSHHA